MPIRTNFFCPYLIEDFGIRLRRLRDNAGYTQKTFAAALGVSVQRINRYEKQGMIPDIDLLIHMASTLHITVDELIGYEPNYDATLTALDLLDNAGVTYEYDTDGATGIYRIVRPHGIPLEMEFDILVSCALEAGNQTCRQLKDTLDPLFLTLYRTVFWQAYGWGLYKKNSCNIPRTITLDDCHETEFSQRLCYYRKLHGWSQTQFSRMLQINKVQTYNRYEMKDAQPSIQLLANMAYALKISVNKLTGAKEPDILERAVEFLRKTGMSCTQNDGKLYMKRPTGLETVMDPEDGLFADNELTEDVELEGAELCYYVAKAWDMTRNARGNLATLYNLTFRQLFFFLAESGLPAGASTRSDATYCLFQQPWSGNAFFMFEDPSKTKLSPVEVARK